MKPIYAIIAGVALALIGTYFYAVVRMDPAIFLSALGGAITADGIRRYREAR